MATSSVIKSTVVDYAHPSVRREPFSHLAIASIFSSRRGYNGHAENAEEDHFIESELRLPSYRSLFVAIGGNALFQFSFFIIVSSASAYAEHLGGSAIFSGLIIGIPTLFSGITLIFMTRLDKGRYKRPFQFAYAAMLLGNVLHGMAYYFNWLYLILLGRVVTGFGFSSFMYIKRYCSDPRIVGIRQRTTLASWLVIGQCFGFSTGPFLGGLLYKVGFSNSIFNGFTSPGWVMAAAWAVFWVISNVLFEDVQTQQEAIQLEPPVQSTLESNLPESTIDTPDGVQKLSGRQWGVIICMCYYAMTCFLILASWESNVPVFTASALGYSPFRAGNFIALGGLASFPFLLLNVRYARRFQDRTTLATGSSLGLAGLLLTLVLLRTDNITFGSFYICWVLVALGFNLASTCTLSLLSKQLPDNWNGRVSLAIQYSNYLGRVTGAILGGAGVKIGMMNYIGVQIAVVGVGGIMYLTLWRELKAKTG